MTATTAAPCWYVDREPWEESHFPTEAQARADAGAEAREDDNPPHPVRRHDVPCREFTCRCGAVFHVLGDVEVPADGRCGDC